MCVIQTLRPCPLQAHGGILLIIFSSLSSKAVSWALLQPITSKAVHAVGSVLSAVKLKHFSEIPERQSTMIIYPCMPGVASQNRFGSRTEASEVIKKKKKKKKKRAARLSFNVIDTTLLRSRVGWPGRLYAVDVYLSYSKVIRSCSEVMMRKVPSSLQVLHISIAMGLPSARILVDENSAGSVDLRCTNGSL